MLHLLAKYVPQRNQTGNAIRTLIYIFDFVIITSHYEYLPACAKMTIQLPKLHVFMNPDAGMFRQAIPSAQKPYTGKPRLVSRQAGALMQGYFKKKPGPKTKPGFIP
ncbi:MAG: hypothetical protein ACLFM1_01075 [Bacteroidales bacterium]